MPASVRQSLTDLSPAGTRQLEFGGHCPAWGGGVGGAVLTGNFVVLSFVGKMTREKGVSRRNHGETGPNPCFSGFTGGCG